MASRTGPSLNLTIGLLLCVAAIAFEAIAVLTAMPAAVADLGDSHLYAWSFTGFVIAQTFAIVVAGQICDRIGPVIPLVSGFTVFAAGVSLAALSTSMPALIGARFVQGLGGGTMNLAVMVLVGLAYPPRRRAVLLTWFSAAWMVPAFIGPAAAAWLARNLSWHAVFWSVLPALGIAGCLVLVPLLKLGLPAPQRRDHSLTRPLMSATAVALGAACLQWAGQEIQPSSLVWLAVGTVGLGVGLPSLMPRGFTAVSAVVGVRSLVAAAFFGVEAFLSLQLISTRGLALEAAGYSLVVGSVGWMIGSWLQSRPWLTWRRDTIITVGASATTAGIALIALTAWTTELPVAIVLTGWTIAGLGMGLAVATTSLAVMQLSTPAQLGRDTSSLQVGEALGSSIGGGLAGTLYVLGHDHLPGAVAFGPSTTAMVAVAALAIVVASRIGPVENHSRRT